MPMSDATKQISSISFLPLFRLSFPSLSFPHRSIAVSWILYFTSAQITKELPRFSQCHRGVAKDKNPSFPGAD